MSCIMELVIIWLYKALDFYFFYLLIVKVTDIKKILICSREVAVEILNESINISLKQWYNIPDKGVGCILWII